MVSRQRRRCEKIRFNAMVARAGSIGADHRMQGRSQKGRRHTLAGNVRQHSQASVLEATGAKPRAFSDLRSYTKTNPSMPCRLRPATIGTPSDLLYQVITANHRPPRFYPGQ
jgi:hypothetical protein